MPWYNIPVTWESYGVIEIEAENEQEFWIKVKQYREDDSELELPDAEYVDGSFEIADDDNIMVLNEFDKPEKGDF